MATLAEIRGSLNAEIGVTTDAETTPWTVTARNNAIRDGYRALWLARAWKPVVESVATATDQFTYDLTTVRRLERLDREDGSGLILDHPRGAVEPDGSGGYHLVVSPIDTGYTLVVRGWAPYKSEFANDADTDDLEDEWARVPLLKAKAILYRAQLATFARYGERQALKPDMNVSVDQLLSLIAASEQEWAQSVRDMAAARPRVGHSLAWRA